MKTNKWYIVIALALFTFAFQAATAQEDAASIIKKAMKDELNRNMNNLALGELKRPFFISYTVSDARYLSIEASLGAIISSDENPNRSSRVKVMVGDYKLTNENFMDMEGMMDMSLSGGGAYMPIDNDYNGIRRSLWLETDKMYKITAETFAKKEASMKQQNLSAEQAGMDDFSKAPIVKMDIKSEPLKYDKVKWEKTVKELSGIFKKYPEIFSSEVSLYFYNADVYFVNSEGSETKYPVSVAAVRVIASTQAEDGASLYDHALFFALNPESLPKENQMKADVKALADRLVEMKKATVFKDSYSGPILFEGQAAGEIFSQRLFGGTSGLLALRKPIISNPQMAMMVNSMMGGNLEEEIDKKILPKSFSIISNPKMKEFKGAKLMGSYQVDAEGVVPKDDLILVEKGVLKTLLNGRTPTRKVPESNGSHRLSFMNGELNEMAGPGVIEISASDGLSNQKLKEKLIEKAKEAELDYALIVRKLESPTAGIKKEFDQNALMALFTGGGKQGAVSTPLYVYKVDLKTGKETLLRNVDLGGISVKNLKNILAASNKQVVYNTLVAMKAGGLDLSLFSSAMPGGWNLSGTPASFIIPEAFIIDDMEAKEAKSAFTKKLPLVENPVGK